MPKKVEKALQRKAREKGLSKERTGAYVYGTMRRQGWNPKREQAEAAGRKRRGVAKTSKRA